MKIESPSGFRVLLLDFTLVMSIDSSAAEMIAKLYPQAKKHNVALCFARGSSEGFPCATSLSNKLLGQSTQSTLTSTNRDHTSVDAISDLCVADDLDSALAWCEMVVIKDKLPAYSDSAAQARQSTVCAALGDPSLACLVAHTLSVCPTVDQGDIQRLLKHFEPKTVPAGTVLWTQGADSECAVFLLDGRMQSRLEEEAGTVEVVGRYMLVGEFGLLNGNKRLTTMEALTEVRLLTLDQTAFRWMEHEKPELALVLARICMAFLGRRTMHVANRIWESHCLPI